VTLKATLKNARQEPKFGAFATTAVLFFLAEMGDKTQLATAALGAHYRSAAVVTVGTTLGMLASDGLAVFLGEKLAEKVEMNYIRLIAAILFFIFGLIAIWHSRTLG
jgi:putative Ca2+/H+ antiporter (TMEM165/GDT1 family)